MSFMRRVARSIVDTSMPIPERLAISPSNARSEFELSEGSLSSMGSVAIVGETERAFHILSSRRESCPHQDVFSIQKRAIDIIREGDGIHGWHNRGVLMRTSFRHSINALSAMPVAVNP